ncbi:MAG: 3-isopropylmalate dehydratase large subunit [Candidatus Hodarchaeales archaeon]|jgi:3-isopropylmalate/(R)-2-methylmalate dehydratase large subunit
MVSQTIIEKIFQNHTQDKKAVKPGKIIWLDIDSRTARDFGGANVVQNLEEFYPDEPKIADPNKTFFTFDCNLPNNIPYAINQQRCRLFARKEEIKVYDVNQGIGSHIMIEEGLVVPGSTIVGTDSHLNITGAVGAFGQGMGDQDIAFVWKTGKTWFEVPPTMRIEVTGSFKAPCTAKDLTLAVLRKLGSDGALGKSVEFAGEAIEKLSLAGRITLSSMVTEMGGIIGFIPPDKTVLDYCRTRAGNSDLEGVYADDDCDYIEQITIDIDNLEPLISLPPNPENVHTVSETEKRIVDSVFIGSCTNGRIEDIEPALSLIKEHGIADGVMVKVVPATREVYRELLKKGFVEALFEMGGLAMFPPGCGGCASGQIGMTGKEEVQISTGNRNFAGKQGAGDTFLASPLTAAACAITGEITSPEEL